MKGVIVVGHGGSEGLRAALALALLRGQVLQEAAAALHPPDPAEIIPIKLYSKPEEAGNFFPPPRSRFLPGDPQPWKRRK